MQIIINCFLILCLSLFQVFQIITFIIKIQRQYAFMNSCGIQFKKFKSEVNCKPIKVRSQFERAYDGAYHAAKTKENIPTISPQRQPTSFRELSSSREKNKIFSGKKNALENKLNTLRSNEKNTIFDISSEEKCQATEFDSGKKEGLFTRLLTSRSPNHGKKNLFADQSNGSVNTTNDSNGISFSAFRGINLGENENYANLVLQKKSQSDQQDKGLKFRAFPHKKTSIGQKQRNLPLSRLVQGPLISQKGGSRSKSKKNDNIKQERSPIKQTIGKWTPSCIGQRDKQHNVGLRRVSTLQQLRENEYGLRLDPKMVKKSIQCSNSKQSADEVIRSREGSMTFDMSPTLF